VSWRAEAPGTTTKASNTTTASNDDATLRDWFLANKENPSSDGG
jgi:hypothetical protein